MKPDEIKKKLEKEIIEEVEDYWSIIVSKLSIAERRFLNKWIILAREETSKAKDKEFLEMIDRTADLFDCECVGGEDGLELCEIHKYAQLLKEELK